MKDVGNLRHRSLIRCPGARITRARKESAATRRWTNAVVRAIEAVCKINPSSGPIAAWDLLKELHKRGRFEEGSAVREKASQGRLGKLLKRWIIEAIESIPARGGDSKTVRSEQTRDNKLMICGLRCR